MQRQASAEVETPGESEKLANYKRRTGTCKGWDWSEPSSHPEHARWVWEESL